MRLDSLSAWLEWLEQNHPQEIDLGLERVACVAARMTLRNPNAKVITVAGTNGKGSCVTATAALLSSAGYSVGVYTSPHLIHYNERIVVDGKPVADDEICSAFAAIYLACQQISPEYPQPISLTYFEYGTLAALEIFRRRNVAVLVLEVGLGGRLDAVNIIDADVAVITSIALDHIDWLGDNRDSIGYEKAGIMRAGKPVICADFAPPKTVLDHAMALAAPLYLISRDFGFMQVNAEHWNWWSGAREFLDQPLPQLPLPSVAAALQVVHLLGLSLPALNAFDCVAALRVPGRFQTIQWNDRQVILDVAHNPAATAYLVERLVQNASPSSSVYGIVAMMSDKDRAQSLANLKGRINHWYLANLEFIPRAATLEQLRQNLADLNVEPEFSGSVAECLQAALGSSNPGDRILICGSFYTVAAGLQALAIPVT
ncbi:bifunctional tetrahydrofolate synthase/dihydrofolate synthase [Cellvibrio mixtus]|uniref:bifunctional tetrahydrofolate synthase/dihydrofolate synthase n=1 Tax=Cellvibrio mixtus TaxID=39650 RepID=UPI000586520B|nr:bifunctional tetrahydrofolate synthase/dihydrofolate synthase [Cellvibrio mixtus]